MTRLGLGDVTENCTNDLTDFQRAKDMGASWAFVRATTTGVWRNGKPGLKVDTRFWQNYEALQKLDFGIWLYSWFDPRLKALEQADFFLTTIQGLEYDALSLDMEDSAKVAVYNAPAIAETKTWLELAETNTGTRPGIYTYPAFVQRWANVDWMSKYPLDLAQWKTASPLEPHPWYPGSRRSWQYTDYAPGASYGFFNPRGGAFRICLSVTEEA